MTLKQFERRFGFKIGIVRHAHMDYRRVRSRRPNKKHYHGYDARLYLTKNDNWPRYIYLVGPRGSIQNSVGAYSWTQRETRAKYLKLIRGKKIVCVLRDSGAVVSSVRVPKNLRAA